MSGARITWVCQRNARFGLGIDTGAAWDSHIPLLHPDDHEETHRVWSNCLKTGLTGELTFRVRDPQGRYRRRASRAEPLRASDGTVLFWVGINFDIEELKQTEFYLVEGQRLARNGSWAFNSAGFEFWSGQLFEIHGLKALAPTDRQLVCQSTDWKNLLPSVY